MNGFYNNGYKDSSWTNFHENGTKEWEGIYKTDIRINDWKYWYSNGQVKKIINYNEGERTLNFFDESGKLLVENGEGSWAEYYENEKIKANGSFTKGRKHGVWKEFYSSGKLANTKQFAENKEDGTWKYFQENENLSHCLLYTSPSPRDS